MKVNKISIRVAGLGTRMLPVSKNKVSAFSLGGEVFDCGDNAEYILANLEFAMKDPSMKTKIKKYLKTRLF